MLILPLDWVIFGQHPCDAGPNQSRSKKEFPIFSSDIFIKCVLEQVRPPWRPCQSHLRKSEWGVLGACRGSLGPDWSNFLCQRGEGERRVTEREKWRRQVTRGCKQKGMTRREVRVGGRIEIQQEREWEEQLTSRRTSEVGAESWNILPRVSLTPQIKLKKRRQAARRASPASLPVWLLPIGHGAPKPYALHWGCHIKECRKTEQTSAFFFSQCFFPSS